MKKCIKAKISVQGTQVLLETEDGKRAVIPARSICEIVKRYNICLEEGPPIKC